MPPPKCAICNSPETKSCASCHSTAYCSLECQQTDWPLHKQVCKALRLIPPRPGPTHKLGMFFPVDSKAPKLVWIICEVRVDDGDGVSYEHAQLRGLLGDDDPFPERKPITRNVFRGFNLNHTVLVVCREAGLVDGSRRNSCVAEMTRGAMAHDWRGPIVMMRQPGTAIDPLIYSDVILEDLRTAVDYFLSYNSDSVIGNTFVRSTGPKIKGVRVNCSGDLQAPGTAEYETVDVPFDHPVFIHLKRPEISRLLDIPVLARKYPPDQSWKNLRKDPYPFTNLAITFLHLDADPQSKSWGSAPIEWDEDVGSVLIVRVDRKAITPKQVQALCYYCQFKLQPAFKDSMGAGEVNRTQEEVMDLMKREHFALFFAEYKRERARDDLSWAAERSPYEAL